MPALSVPKSMLPSADAAWVGEELTRRFGLPRWQMAMTATDANRFVLRFARHLTGRPKVLVFDWCYHGTVDEAFATLDLDAYRAAFESNAMALQAVLDGTGVAVAQFPYVSDALAAGRLVSPFSIVARKRENWLLEYRPIRQDEPALIAFRNWLRREAEKQCQAEAALLSQSKTKSIAAV